MLVFCVSHHLLCPIEFFLCVFHCLLMCDCSKSSRHESLQLSLVCKVFLNTKQVFLKTLKTLEVYTNVFCAKNGRTKCLKSSLIENSGRFHRRKFKKISNKAI